MSSTNRSAERIEFDAYYTQENLAEKLVQLLPILPGDRVWEPHAGGGAFVRALVSAQAEVTASDINPEAPGLDRNPGLSFVGDFLNPNLTDGVLLTQLRHRWIVGNPPFTDFEKHLDKALGMAPNVAFLLRLAVTESASRIESWTRWPLRKVWVLAERPSFTGGKTDSAAYGFFWFERGYRGEAGIVPGWSWKGPKRARGAA